METSAFNLSASNVTITTILPEDYNHVVYQFSITSESSLSAQSYDYVESTSLSGDSKLLYIIYRTTCKVNNKIYVGQKDIRRKDYKTYLGSGTYFKRAVKKYGKENFYRETIEFCISATKEDREIFWIAGLSATNPSIGYNISEGGDGCGTARIGLHHSKESRQKMSDSHKGKIISEEHKRKIGEANKGRCPSEETLKKMRENNGMSMLGKKHSEESKIKMSKSHQGIPAWNKGKPSSEETIKKLITSHLGHRLSEETRKKISASHKGKIFSEEHRRHLSQANFGKPKSDESKRKLSDSMKKIWEARKKKSEEI